MSTFFYVNGVIAFSLPPTNGIGGEQWLAIIENEGKQIGGWIKQTLRSGAFKPTVGKVYAIKIFRNEILSAEEITAKKLCKLNVEALCIIRKNFTDDELKSLGLWQIIVKCDITKASGGALKLLPECRDEEGRWLCAYCVYHKCQYARTGGFAFMTTQV